MWWERSVLLPLCYSYVWVMLLQKKILWILNQAWKGYFGQTSILGIKTSQGWQLANAAPDYQDDKTADVWESEILFYGFFRSKFFTAYVLIRRWIKFQKFSWDEIVWQHTPDIQSFMGHNIMSSYTAFQQLTLCCSPAWCTNTIPNWRILSVRSTNHIEALLPSRKGWKQKVTILPTCWKETWYMDDIKALCDSAQTCQSPLLVTMKFHSDGSTQAMPMPTVPVYYRLL